MKIRIDASNITEPLFLSVTTVEFNGNHLFVVASSKRAAKKLQEWCISNNIEITSMPDLYGNLIFENKVNNNYYYSVKLLRFPKSINDIRITVEKTGILHNLTI